MRAESIGPTSSRLQSALNELRDTIRQRYPEATFSVSRGEDDPSSVQLNATVDVDDTDEVMDLVIDRLLQFQIDEELPIHVIPVRPLERVLAEMGREHHERRDPLANAALGL